MPGAISRLRAAVSLRTRLRAALTAVPKPDLAGPSTEPWMERLDMEPHRGHGYQSQFGQDIFFDVLFQSVGLDRGVYVDVGAHDGVSGSNTMFFERHGWSGVCIEPLPGPFARLQVARSARCFKCAVGEIEGEQSFLTINGYSEMLSGLVSQYDPRHLYRIEQELVEYGGDRAEISVPVRRLEAILDECSIDRIDLLSVDVEGGEMGVIRSLDLTRTTIFALAIENGYGDDEVAEDVPVAVEFRDGGPGVIVRSLRR